MSNEALAGWAVAVVALLALIWDRIDRRSSKGRAAMDARLSPIELMQAKQAESLTRLEIGQEHIQTKMDEHEKQDTARFDDIGKMFAEIRGDLKSILKGARDQ